MIPCCRGTAGGRLWHAQRIACRSAESRSVDCTLAGLPQVDLQLESGEYFLAQQERAKRSKASQQAQQAERTADRKRKRQEAFMAPQVRHAARCWWHACMTAICDVHRLGS